MKLKTKDKPRYFRVCVTGGETRGNNGEYLGKEIIDGCGHLHKSEEAAYECFDALYELGQNAHWHGAQIIEVDADGAEIL